ncbi:MAG: ACT domain-containing protein [Culicoidibacterales bacterium]
MRGIITVLGKDTVGIIAKVCTYLANQSVNVLDLSQAITQGNFHMIMIVDTAASDQKFEVLIEQLTALGEEIGVIITLQNEEIFNAMHRI